MNSCDICGNREFRFLFERDGSYYYRCIFCKLEKIYPQPLPAELARIYNDAYYEAWGAWKEERVYQIKKRTFKHRLNLIKHKKYAKILDCGCANGAFLDVANEYGFEAFGIELNKAAVQTVRNSSKAKKVCLGDFRNYIFDDAPFYAVFMNDFLEHMDSPRSIILKTWDLLQAGGYLVITTPNTNSFSCKTMRKSWPHYKTEHLFYFNPDNVSLLVKKAGFRVVSIKRGWKCLTLDYIRSIFLKYPRKYLTFIVNKAVNYLPQHIRSKNIWCCFGEMVIVAQKIKINESIKGLGIR